MNTEQIRDTFLEFFCDRGHRRITGSTLLPPPGDHSVLFTTSGMHQLTPYFLGDPHPHGRRLVNLQRCLRGSAPTRAALGEPATLPAHDRP